MAVRTGQLLLKTFSKDVTVDSGMMKWICGVSLKDLIQAKDLLLCLGLISINDILRWNRRVSMDTCYVALLFDCRQPRGRPRKSLCDVICVDMKLLNLSNEDTNHRAVWSRAIKLKKLMKHAGVLSTLVDSAIIHKIFETNSSLAYQNF